MARRGNNQPSVMAAILGFIVLAGVGGGLYSYLGRSAEPFRTVQALDSVAYLENANGLRGNVYKIDGVVLNSLAWVPSKGRLYSFEIKNGSRTDVVAVMIPAQFNSLNLQKGQRFWVKLEVGTGGVLFAQDLIKV